MPSVYYKATDKELELQQRISEKLKGLEIKPFFENGDRFDPNNYKRHQ